MTEPAVGSVHGADTGMKSLATVAAGRALPGALLTRAW